MVNILMKYYFRKFWVVTNIKISIFLSFCSILVIFFFYWVFFLSNLLFESDKIEFYIKTNSSFDELLDDLRPYLKSETSFTLASKFKKFDKNVKPGKYVIEKNVPDKKFNGVTKKFEKVLWVSHVLNKIPTKQPKHEKKIITIIK